MTAEKLAALKAHMHVDHNDDDAQIEELFAAAEEYLLGAGVAPSESKRYFLVAASLTLEWYDGGAPGTPPTVGLRQLINQLKLEAVAQMQTPVL